MSVLAYNGVGKQFGAHRALANVSLEVAEGEVFGLLGPNGAGKTTLIRIGLDILRPDSGSVALFGEPLRRAALDRVSYLPEERGVYRRANVHDLLTYFGRLKGLTRADARAAAWRWLGIVGLQAVAAQRVETLSKGMTQKVQIAATLMTDPPLCVLDEPFSGLDPVNVGIVKRLIAERKAAGQTTILSTHMMHQVEALCDRVALVHRGHLVVYGELDEIRRRYSRPEVIVRTPSALKSNGLAERVEPLRDNTWRIHLKEAVDPVHYLRCLITEGVEVQSYEPVVATMDEIFVQLVSEGAE